MIFGIRAVIEAVQAGKEIDRLLVKKDMQGDLSKELFAAIKGLDIPVQRVPVERLNRITRKNHQGVIAFTTQITYQHVEDLVPMLFEEGKDPFFVLLDGVTDVRNFGAIARTAECAGVDAIIIPSKGSVSVNADAIKTSAGALHTLPVCRENQISSTIKYLKNCGIRIVGATEKGDKDYTKGDSRRVTRTTPRVITAVPYALSWEPRTKAFRRSIWHCVTNGHASLSWARSSR